MKITDTIRYAGVNDRSIDLFEGMFAVPDGMAYHSYVILDEKNAVIDTVAAGFTNQWLQQIKAALEGRNVDYLVIQHMEPDHSANIMNFMGCYPDATVVASAKAFRMMEQFFGEEFRERRIVVSDGDILSLGKHKLMFFTAEMVHWPEVIMTYDSTEQIFFSADAFGTFGALTEEQSGVETWKAEARRYYFGIVGKYGVQVQKLLQKISGLTIQKICPLHGSILTSKPEEYLKLYQRWSSYQPEAEGVVIAYTSVYGNTQKAAVLLEQLLRQKGCREVICRDLARCELSYAVSEAFAYDRLVLATTTYNADIFPRMREFISWLKERNYQNRTVALLENGSWSCIAARLMKEQLERCRGLEFLEPVVTIQSAMSEENITRLELLAQTLCRKKKEESR